MNWKIKRDSFYSNLYEKFGEDYITEAGFIYDTSKEDFDGKATTDILCTHIPDLKDVKNPVVLVTTGAFCPFHEGHLTMMMHAKEEIEKAGNTVVAGYISPSHDEYVLEKIVGGYNIHERLRLIERDIREYDWLFVDPWEGLFVKHAINFTDVIDRLEHYIFIHTGIKVPVYFVCGADNAKFALTFADKGNCVVVKRPGYDETRYSKISFLNNERILWADGNSKESSSNIRKKGMIKFAKKSAYVRKENAHPYEERFIKMLEKFFSEIEVANFTDQRKMYENIKPSGIGNIPVVSLDRLINGDINFGISRLYSMFGIRKFGYHDRGLDREFSGECYLFDDDVATGGTINYATNRLKKMGIKIRSFFTFKFSAEVEILDCRDFLIGHPDGGLFVKLPNGKISRVPYIYPFVCPYTRSTVLKPMEFSYEVWMLNKEYFTSNPAKVKDMTSVREAFICAGFSDEDEMSYVCDHYAKVTKVF